MKVNTKKVDSTKREIYIEADPESVREKFEDVFNRINKEAKIPGFRTGHIPLNILEKHYGQQANQMVLEELIPEVYRKAIEKENLEVVDYPDIYDIKLDKNNLSFKAKVEVIPEINLKNYRGIKLHYKKTDISEKEVNNYIDSLLKQRKIEKLDDDFARSLGYPNLDALRSSIEKQIYIQRENQNRQDMENTILEYLLKEADFKVPESLVKRKLDYLLRQAKLDLLLKGFSKEEIEAKEKQLEDELRPQAEKQARLEVIFTQIAKKENLPQDENMFQHVLEFLFREADWQEAR